MEESAERNSKLVVAADQTAPERHSFPVGPLAAVLVDTRTGTVRAGQRPLAEVKGLQT
jgi:hypothetical protein